MSEFYRGVFPVVPTPFSDSGELDLEGQKRVLDCMIEQGVDGVCILANYSEQFVLKCYENDDYKTIISEVKFMSRDDLVLLDIDIVKISYL